MKIVAITCSLQSIDLALRVDEVKNKRTTGRWPLCSRERKKNHRLKASLLVVVIVVE